MTPDDMTAAETGIGRVGCDEHARRYLGYFPASGDPIDPGPVCSPVTDSRNGPWAEDLDH